MLGGKNMLCGLVMAGGRGERFWPLSTEEKPKQFLNLLGEDTMIQMTVKRLLKIIPIERIFIVTAEKYMALVREQLPFLPSRNIIIEPVGKNTAPCIVFSAFLIEKYYKDATIAVLPSDHLIKDEEAFSKTLKYAEEFIKKEDNSIITLGIVPDRPETGYGYIKYIGAEDAVKSFKIYPAERFVEKPDIETAKAYIKDGNYLWNSGIFVWKTSTIKNLAQEFLPKTFERIKEIADAFNEDNFNEVLRSKYSQVDSISVDYGIMEKADKIYVIPSDFGWDDVGTWTSIERYCHKDADNNVSIGWVKNYNSRNNLVVGDGKKIALIGIEDIFVIDTKDILLIGKKNHLYKMKNVRQEITL